MEVHYGNQNDKPFNSTLAFNKNTVFSTLPEEYAEAILNTTVDFIHKNPNFPPGTLIFTAGAHCEIGSSRFLFGKIASILLSIILIKNDNYEAGEIDELLGWLVV